MRLDKLIHRGHTKINAQRILWNEAIKGEQQGRKVIKVWNGPKEYRDLVEVRVG
jgi:hypothetical protein